MTDTRETRCPDNNHLTCSFFVGLGRFELPTFGPPDRRANQAAPQPAVDGSLYRRASRRHAHVMTHHTPWSRRHNR